MTERSWRYVFFKNRGTLLALPAVSLVVFGRPTAASFAIGMPLALGGEALRCWAVGYSGVTTRSDRVVAPQLVTAGPYAYVRNPLYVGNFITAVGFTLVFVGGVSTARRTVLALTGLGMMLAVYAAIVPLEEAYLRETFGAPFDGYVASVPRIVPQVTPAADPRGAYDASVIARAETRTFVSFGAMVIAAVLKALRRQS